MDIKLLQVSKSFGAKKVLNKCTLVFPARKRTVILAPSGFGKTTILRILMGLEDVDEGEILGLQQHRLAAVFQENRLCETLSVYKNLQMVTPDLSKAELDRFLAAFALPKPYDVEVATYSGGMKRRVSLLRALLATSTCLIFDEPFKGLDYQTKELVVKQTLKMTQNKTCIFVLHEAEEVKLLSPDQVLRLDLLKEKIDN